MFRKTVFHFHAAGLCEIYPSLSALLKFFFLKAYASPDLAILLSEHNPDDAAFLGAKHQRVVPNGIPDHQAVAEKRLEGFESTCTMLYVGLVSESKGILDLVEVLHILKSRGLPVCAKVVGEFESPEFRRKVIGLIDSSGLSGCCEFTGPLTGSEKDLAYQSSDIFCFPTYFESESFGLVVVEAMQFGLPVVATRWRGVQSLVREDVTGYLTEIRDTSAMAERVEYLVLNPSLRSQMGRAARCRYMEEYTVEKFWERMNSCFKLVSEDLKE